MHSSAGDLAALLDADLINNGWTGAVSPFPGMTVRECAMQSLRRSLVSKFHNNETSPERDAAAEALFLETNEACRTYRPDLSTVDELLWTAIGEAKSFIDRFCSPQGLPLLSLSKIERHVGFGVGANIGAKSGDPYGKLAISDLTYTDPALLILFQQTIRGRNTWLEQEQFRASLYKTREVQGSIMSFVPKKFEISRTVCKEAILNMFYQKGTGGVTERRLDGVVGIDLSKQPDRNRLLARLGSVTGEVGTIDLKSASDSQSLTLTREWFPDHFVRWLELFRSKQTRLVSGKWVDLHMVSSMGNAFTFPLQTLLFTAMVVGSYRALDIEVRYPGRHAWLGSSATKLSYTESTVGNFAVFGDDIIVQRQAYELVTRMLRYCGFTVNHDKSFNEGLFRESCGHDYYQGHDVRGVYIKKLRDDLDCYSAYNRLSRWSVKQGVNLWNCLEYLKKRVSRRLFVPLHEDDEAGFKVPLQAVPAVIKRARYTKTIRYIAAARKQLVLRLPNEEEEFDSKIIARLRRAIPGWTYNPAGLLLLVLHGNVRDSFITIRFNDNRGRAAYWKRQSPCWDFDGSVQAARPEYRKAMFYLASVVFYNDQQ